MANLPQIPGTQNNGNVHGFWKSGFIDSIVRMVGMMMHGSVDASENYNETHANRDEIVVQSVTAGRVTFGGLVASSDQSVTMSGTRSIKSTPVDEETDSSHDGNGKGSKHVTRRGFLGR